MLSNSDRWFNLRFLRLRRVMKRGLPILTSSWNELLKSKMLVLCWRLRENPSRKTPCKCARTKKSASPNPVSGAAAVMGYGDDAYRIGLQLVNQGIRKAMERQHPRIVQTGLTQLRESGQHIHCLLDLVEKIIRSDECAFADVPFDSGVGIRLCLTAKADRVLFWQH